MADPRLASDDHHVTFCDEREHERETAVDEMIARERIVEDEARFGLNRGDDEHPRR